MPVEDLLPDDFEESLALVPNHQPVSLLTRHSIREEASNYNAHHGLPLTKDGIALARYWGSVQPFDSLSLYSSPVGRCIETAKHLWAGQISCQETNEETGEATNKDIDKETPPCVEIIPSLAEPGCFIENKSVMHQLGKVFVKEGHLAYLNQIVSGGFSEYLSVDAGVAKLINHLRDTQKSCSGKHLNLHVSHDTVLGTFIYRLLGYTRLEQKHWPRMMEGAYIWFDDPFMHVVWRSEKFTVNITGFCRSESL